MYSFSAINHHIILTYSVLIGLTPFIPIPFLDDWVRGAFLRGMVRQIANARAVLLTPGQIEALAQENAWVSCAEGCFYGGLYILREFFSKIFFFIEWQRAFQLVGQTYYTGFLLDAALMDGYPAATPDGSTAAAAHLCEAIRRARYRANTNRIEQLVRDNLSPRILLRAALALSRRAIASLPGLIAALPRVIIQTMRSAPGQVSCGLAAFWANLRSMPARTRENFYLAAWNLMRRDKTPEMPLIERLVASLQTGLTKMDSTHFDELRNKLVNEINRQDTITTHN